MTFDDKYNANKIRIGHLRSFLYSYQLSSFSKAAIKLQITQSAITKNIKALESQLDTKLFNRDTRNFKPTKAGEILYPTIESLCVQATKLEQSLETIHSGNCGEVTIGFDRVFSPYASQFITKLFSQRFPKSKLFIVDEHVKELHNKLLKGKLDFYIYNHTAYNYIDSTEHLIVKPLLSMDAVAVVSPNAEFLKDSNDITTYKWVFPTINKYFSEHNFWNSYQEIKDKGNMMYEIDNNHTRINLALDGVAATVLPLFTVKEQLEQGTLIKITNVTGSCSTISLLSQYKSTGKQV